MSVNSPNEHSVTPRQNGFTLVEMLVVVVIVVMLMTLLLPSLMYARELARTSQCSSNLRQMGVAELGYNMDNKLWYTEFTDVVASLAQYTGTDPKFYHWAGYNNTGYYNNMKAAPFKCPLVIPYTQFAFTTGYMSCMNLSSTDPYDFSNANCVIDYATASALHGRGLPQNNGTTRWWAWSRQADLVHSPSVVLNMTDSGPGVSALDYSTFGAYARHQNYHVEPVQYADNHVTLIYNQNSSNPWGALVNRGAVNSNPDPSAPYCWY